MAANNFHELPNPHSSVSGVNTSDAGNQKPSRVAEKWRPAGTPVTEPKVSTISRFAGRLIDRLTGKAYSADELLNRDITAADITDASASGQAVLTGTPAQGRKALAVEDHPLAEMALRPLAECLRQGLSASVAVIGDSTGAGTTTVGDSSGWKWPRYLAKSIADAHPEMGVNFWQITADATKAWTKTEVQAAPNGELREYWLPLTAGIADWSANTEYVAGNFVKTTSGGTKYWFCKVSHRSGSTPPSSYSYPSTGDSNWTEYSADTSLVASGEDSPYIHDSTATASKIATTKKVEIEVDFVMPPLGAAVSEKPLFTKRGPVGDTDGMIQVSLWDNGVAVFRWWEQPGPGYTRNATTSTVLPVSAGTRLKLRVSFTTDNGTNRVIEFAYSTYSADVWSAYTVHQTIPAAKSNWYIPNGPIQLGGVYGGVSTMPGLIIYGATVRRGVLATDAIDFNLPLDCYSSYGTKVRAMLGSPICNVWSASWSGANASGFLGDSYIVGTTYFNIASDLPSPDNVCAAFVNLGHNGQSNTLTPGKGAKVIYGRLSDALQDRFPRASILGMSQNPGVAGTLTNALDYRMHEYNKTLKHSYEMQEAMRRGDGFVDVNRAFRTYATPADLLISQDGLHPNATGSKLWADTIFGLIEQ